MANAWKPYGFTSVAPYLITRNAQQLIDFLGATLNATPLRRFDKPDGSIAHAEVRIDDTVVMMGEVGEESVAVPCHLHVYVEDVDRTYQAALANGATSVQEPNRREGDADRRGGVTDPGGNTWWFSTQIED